MTQLENKHNKLKQILSELGSVLVAFSGGVDSTLLLKVAFDTLGSDAIAFTEDSPLHQSWEIAESKEIAAAIGVRQMVFHSDELGGGEFANNPPDRCYICKTQIFTKALSLAKELGLAAVVDGSNVDDLSEYRPGRRALEELRVRSPLLDAGFNKPEIRELSFKLGLPTWNRQSLACLASRIPYNTRITVEKLRSIESCETFLKELGFEIFRVRHHGEIARIELRAEDFHKAIELRSRISEMFKKAGFNFTTLDLDGFRSGSMDEGLKTTK